MKSLLDRLLDGGDLRESEAADLLRALTDEMIAAPDGGRVPRRAASER